MHEVIDSRAERSCPGANLTEVSNRAPLTEDKFPFAFFIPAALHIPVILLLIFIKAQKSLEKLKQESTFEISTIPSIHEVDSDLSDGSSKVSYKFYKHIYVYKTRKAQKPTYLGTTKILHSCVPHFHVLLLHCSTKFHSLYSSIYKMYRLSRYIITAKESMLSYV